MMALTPKRLFLSLCISISLLRPYTFFSRSPLVFKTLFENACELQWVVLYFKEAKTMANELSFRRSPLVQLRASFVGSDPRMGIWGISRCELCRSVRLLSWWPIWSQLSWTLSLEPFSLASFVFGKPFLVAIFLAVLPWIFYACAVKSDSAADTRKKAPSATTT